MPPPPPLPRLTFRSRVARAHVVCSINALACLIVTLVSPHEQRWPGGPFYPENWNWKLGTAFASLANLALLIVLAWAFPRWHAGEVVLFITVLCAVASIVVGVMSWSIV